MPSCFHPGRGGPINHIDGSDLGLGLQEHPSPLGELSGHVLDEFALRGNGITEIALDPRSDGRFCDCLIPPQK